MKVFLGLLILTVSYNKEVWIPIGLQRNWYKHLFSNVMTRDRSIDSAISAI